MIQALISFNVTAVILMSASNSHAFDVEQAHQRLLAEATGYFAHAGGDGGAGGQVVYVQSLEALGAGSLAALLEQPGRMIILFEDGLDGTISFEGKVHVKSNKTLWGRHRDGSAADIFLDPDPDESAGLLIENQSNVIVANLKGDASGIANDDAPDLIRIQGEGGIVWVHHVSAIGAGGDNMDGFVDVHAENVTLSWNRVSNWDNVHLIYPYPDDSAIVTVTMHHNLFRDTAARHPKTYDNAYVHAYNNWLDRWGYAGMRADGGEIRADANVFSPGGDELAIEGTWNGEGNAFLDGAHAVSASSHFDPPYTVNIEPVTTSAEVAALQQALEQRAGWQATFADLPEDDGRPAAPRNLTLH